MTDEKEKLYEVEKIIERRCVKGKYEYKIKWKGYDLNDCTWEPIKNLKNVLSLVNEFDQQHPKEKNNLKNDSIGFLNKKRSKNEIEEKTNENNNNKNHNNNHNNNENNNNNNHNNNNNNNNNNEIPFIENNPEITDSITFEGKIFKPIEIDERCLEVLTIKKNENKLIALVSFKQNGLEEPIKKNIPTDLLAKINPNILLNFYESKIKFT